VCTLLTVSRDLYDQDVVGRILDDAVRNDDGWALLLADEMGAYSLIRTKEIAQVLAALRSPRWQRMFLHARMATQGAPTVPNIHGWVVDDVCVMHNGCLRAAEAQLCAVDSQAIGVWIRRQGIDYALARLKDELFANVFLIDLEANMYIVHRSTIGSLYTDGQGNYSTYPVGNIALSVEDYSVDCHDLLPPMQKGEVVA
jgi:predicted glutamine amidotransferase